MAHLINIEKIDIYRSHIDGDTPLDIAVTHGYKIISKCLLKKIVNNVKNPEALNDLIVNPYNISKIKINSIIPKYFENLTLFNSVNDNFIDLWISVMEDDCKTVKFLVTSNDFSEDICNVRKNGKTLLMNIVKNNNYCMFMIVADSMNSDYLSIALKQKDGNDKSLITTVVEQNSVNIIKYLSNRPDINLFNDD